MKRLELSSPKAASPPWKDGYCRAVQSRIAALIKFAKRPKPYIDGLIAHCRYPPHTSLPAGINNKIKVIKRIGYGFMYDEYFFLKIRVTFLGMRR